MNHPLHFFPFTFLFFPVCSIPISTLDPPLLLRHSIRLCSSFTPALTCLFHSSNLSPSHSLPKWRAERVAAQPTISLWRQSSLRARSCSPHPWVHRVMALFRSWIMQILIPFCSHLRLAGHEIRKELSANKSFKERGEERGGARRYGRRAEDRNGCQVAVSLFGLSPQTHNTLTVDCLRFLQIINNLHLSKLFSCCFSNVTTANSEYARSMQCATDGISVFPVKTVHMLLVNWMHFTRWSVSPPKKPPMNPASQEGIPQVVYHVLMQCCVTFVVIVHFYT